MIFNNWFNWIKKDEKFSDLLNEIGSEDDELFTKKAYKSNIYKEFIENKIAPAKKHHHRLVICTPHQFLCHC